MTLKTAWIISLAAAIAIPFAGCAKVAASGGTGGAGADEDCATGYTLCPQDVCFNAPCPGAHPSEYAPPCVDLKIDPVNCGACGTVCPAGHKCVASVCM